MGFRKFVTAGSLVISVCATAIVPAAAPAAAAGEALVTASSCSGVDASTVSWSWAKPALEYSTDGGATYTTAGVSSPWKMVACRESGSMKMYWIGVRAAASPTSEDLGAAGLASGLQFRITLTAKAGDTLSSMAGYSDMVSYSETSGTATIVTKAVALSKVNYGNLSNSSDLATFMTRHPECAGLTLQTIMQCSLTKADTDLTATVIQHAMYSDSALNQMESMMKGMWVGAGVNSFQMAMSCNSYSSQYGSGSSSGTAPSFSVTMSGTPHLKADGVSLNRGSMKAFITADVAKKCFGNSAGTSTLVDIAKALTVSRTEAKEGTSTVAVQSTAVTSPVEGIIVTVADMTFSNPEYTIKSTMSAYMAGAGTSSGSTSSGGTTSGSTSSGSTSSYSISKKGSKATLKIVLGAATTVKIYLKTTGAAKLIKTLSGKKGTNTYVTSWKSGYSFIIRSKTGTQLALLK